MRMVLITTLALALFLFPACGRGQQALNFAPTTQSTPISTSVRQQSADVELTKRIQTLGDAVAGDIGVAIVHVESGRAIEVQGAKKLPLYSVYKLPLVLTVLQEVEAGRLQLDRNVRVSPADVSPGSQFNTDLWRQPQEKTVTELIEYAIVRSDNTSADKLLQLIGGPSVVTQQMRTLGFSSLEIVVSSREFAAHRDKANTGATNDLAQLLTRLQNGEILQPAHFALVRGYMERARTGGERRIRANLPTGTQVAEKTGTGDVATNDVGLVTLPDNKGHLAIAVLISGSKLPLEKQEKTIAEIARVAYDSFVANPQ